MSITIRQAKSDDSVFLSEMILQSSRAGKKDGLFDLLFESNDNAVVVKKIQALTQTSAKSHCHYSNFLIAMHDDQPVGTLCSYEPRIATKETFIAALAEIGVDNADATLEVLYNCDFKLNNRTLMFDFMEELEGFLDIGILKELMQKSLLSARLKGYRIAQTVIEIGSLEAHLFYKKMGFSEVAQLECELYREKFGRTGLMLMAIEF